MVWLELKGSCYCETVSFSLTSHTPYPYMHCYCSICRKTNGAGGSAVNLMGLKDTLTVDNEDKIETFRAPAERTEGGGTGRSSSRRRFCSSCGGGLWVFNPDYDQWLYPFASAIDTDLPSPPERNHIMLKYKPDWVPVPDGPNDNHFDTYPELSIEEWHKRHDLLRE